MHNWKVKDDILASELNAWVNIPVCVLQVFVLFQLGMSRDERSL